ncbi:MAG: hypothetical protein KKF44_07200 [Nanoarchaeota archaeon]|nr:hypothetical protein [Nanoarchaeota archaeon]
MSGKNKVFNFESIKEITEKISSYVRNAEKDFEHEKNIYIAMRQMLSDLNESELISKDQWSKNFLARRHLSSMIREMNSELITLISFRRTHTVSLIKESFNLIKADQEQLEKVENHLLRAVNKKDTLTAMKKIRGHFTKYVNKLIENSVSNLKQDIDELDLELNLTEEIRTNLHSLMRHVKGNSHLGKLCKKFRLIMFYLEFRLLLLLNSPAYVDYNISEGLELINDLIDENELDEKEEEEIRIEVDKFEEELKKIQENLPNHYETLIFSVIGIHINPHINDLIEKVKVEPEKNEKEHLFLTHLLRKDHGKILENWDESYFLDNIADKLRDKLKLHPEIVENYLKEFIKINCKDKNSKFHRNVDEKVKEHLPHMIEENK